MLRGEESRVLLKDIDDISAIMRQAIVSIEDQRYYEHNGVDTRGITRALAGHPLAGASSRVARRSRSSSSRTRTSANERTIARKVREAALAWQLEQRWRRTGSCSPT